MGVWWSAEVAPSFPWISVQNWWFEGAVSVSKKYLNLSWILFAVNSKIDQSSCGSVSVPSCPYPRVIRVPDYSWNCTEKWGSSAYQKIDESLPPRHIMPCSCSPLFIGRIRGMEKWISFPNPSRTKPSIIEESRKHYLFTYKLGKLKNAGGIAVSDIKRWHSHTPFCHLTSSVPRIEHYLHSRRESLVEAKNPLENTLTPVWPTLMGCLLPVPVLRNSLIKAKPCAPTAVFTRVTVPCPLKVVLRCCQLCLYRYGKLHVANHLPNTLWIQLFSPSWDATGIT